MGNGLWWLTGWVLLALVALPFAIPVESEFFPVPRDGRRGLSLGVQQDHVPLWELGEQAAARDELLAMYAGPPGTWLVRVNTVRWRRLALYLLVLSALAALVMAGWRQWRARATLGEDGGRYDLDAIRSDDDTWGNDLFAALHRKIAERPGTPLTEAERNVFLVFELARLVHVDGFDGYYRCVEADHHAAALAALVAVGAPAHAKVIESSYACWPGGAPPVTAAEREGLLRLWDPQRPASESFVEANARWDETGEDLDQILKRYIEANRDEFERR